jgi:hypothetical protein
MSRKHVVGGVDRRGQWKRSICDARGPYQTIRSIMKPVFRRLRWICCTYESLKCLDIQIWRFLCWQTDWQTDRTDHITPCCACARGVNNNIIICMHCRQLPISCPHNSTVPNFTNSYWKKRMYPCTLPSLFRLTGKKECSYPHTIALPNLYLILERKSAPLHSSVSAS